MKWRTQTGSQTASLRYKWETCHECGDLCWLWLHHPWPLPYWETHTHTHTYRCACAEAVESTENLHDSSHTIWHKGQVWQCMEMAGKFVDCNTHGEKALLCHIVRMDEISGTQFIWSNENILCSNMLHFWNEKNIVISNVSHLYRTIQ